ncbi:amino acid adenylation domain-containing protein [Vibrio caribbeanicus]|nr:amino acid adenylation domain-containing protein [Vibrio caribbeanicus]
MNEIYDNITKLPFNQRKKIISLIDTKGQEQQTSVRNWLVAPDYYKCDRQAWIDTELSLAYPSDDNLVSYILLSYAFVLSRYSGTHNFSMRGLLSDQDVTVAVNLPTDVRSEDALTATPTNLGGQLPLYVNHSYLYETEGNGGASNFGFLYNTTEYIDGCDAALVMTEFDGNLEVTASFNPHVYDEALIVFMMDKVNACISAFIAGQSVDDILVLGPKGKELDRLHAFSFGNSLPLKEASIIPRILSNIELGKERPCITHPDVTLSNEDLYAKVRQFTLKLEELGIGRGDRVCLYAQRSPDAVAAIIAILSLGATYVPVDIKSPVSLLAYIVKDSNSKLIITSVIEWTTEFSIPTLQMEGVESPSAQHDVKLSCLDYRKSDLAYIIYTSGTTGSPKGVKISHGSLANFVAGISKDYQITSEDTVLQFSSLAFDVSVFDIFCSLFNGSKLAMIPDDHKADPQKLAEFICHQGVTIAEIPPVLLEYLKKHLSRLTSLRLLSLGGEKFSNKFTLEFTRAGIEVVNGYGPTEATVAVTTYRCRDNNEVNPSIGRPLPNVRTFILDENHDLVPLGMPGLLFVAGPSLSEGYINLDKVTEDSFVCLVLPWGETIRAYNTGDICRFRSDGNLDIYGRSDRQVSINGHRVELLQIENTASSMSVIEQCSAIHEKGALYLFYTTNKDKHIAPELLFSLLKDELPYYMIPSKVIHQDEIPLTLSGKVDESKLRRKIKSASQSSGSQGGSAMMSSVEKIVHQAIPTFDGGPGDDFLNSGGDSLAIIKIVSDIKKTTGIELTSYQVYSNPNVSSLVTLIEKNGYQSTEVVRNELVRFLNELWLIKSRPSKKPKERLVFFHCAGGSPYDAKPWEKDLEAHVEVYLVHLPAHGNRKGEPPLNSIDEMAEILAQELVSFADLPLSFIGHSMGGLLAYETARKLSLQGVDVRNLMVVASRSPNLEPDIKISDEADDKAFLTKLFSFGQPTERSNIAELTQFIGCLRADATASENYYLEPNNALTSDLHIFFGKDDPFTTTQHLDEWSKYTQGAVNQYLFESGHFVIEECTDRFSQIVRNIIGTDN